MREVCADALVGDAPNEFEAAYRRAVERGLVSEKRQQARSLSKEFGAAVKAARKASGLSQTALGELAGMCKHTVGRLERGERVANVRPLGSLWRRSRLPSGSVSTASSMRLTKWTRLRRPKIESFPCFVNLFRWNSRFTLALSIQLSIISAYRGGEQDPQNTGDTMKTSKKTLYPAIDTLSKKIDNVKECRLHATAEEPRMSQAALQAEVESLKRSASSMMTLLAAGIRKGVPTDMVHMADALVDRASILVIEINHA